MKRRIFVVAAVVAVLSTPIHAADSARTQDPELPQKERMMASLRALFHRAPGVIADDANGIAVGPMQVDVIVARIDEDGKLVKACVDSEEAARKFLEGPVGKVNDPKAKEQ